MINGLCICIIANLVVAKPIDLVNNTRLMNGQKCIAINGDEFNSTVDGNKLFTIPGGNQKGKFKVGYTFSDQTVKVETYRDIGLNTPMLGSGNFSEDVCCTKSGGCKRLRDGYPSNSCNPSAKGCCTTIADPNTGASQCVDYGEGHFSRIMNPDFLKDTCKSEQKCHITLALKVLNQHALSSQHNEQVINFQIDAEYNGENSLHIRDSLIESLSFATQAYMKNTKKCNIKEEETGIPEPLKDEQDFQAFQMFSRFEQVSASNEIWVSRENEDGSTTNLYHFRVEFLPIVKPNPPAQSIDAPVCNSITNSFKEIIGGAAAIMINPLAGIGAKVSYELLCGAMDILN